MADLEWVFQVVDKASGPLKHIDQKLGAMPNDLSKVEAALKKVDHAAKLQGIAKMRDPLKQTQALLTAHRNRLLDVHRAEAKMNAGAGAGAGASLSSSALGLAAGAGMAFVGVLEKIGSSAAGAAVNLFKFALEASESKRAMVASLRVFGEADADRTFSILQKMGLAAGVSADKAVASFRDLRAAGFEAKGAQDILAASFDVSAALGGGEQGAAAAEKFRDLFTKFETLQKAGSKDILKLATEARIGPEVLAEALGKRMKTSSAEAKLALEQGRVAAADMQNALLDVVQTKFDKGGGLGTLAKSFASSNLPSQLQRTKDLLSNLFEDVDASPLTNALKKFGDALEGDSGKRLGELANKVFGALKVLDKIDVAKGVSTTVSVIISAVDAAERFGDAFSKAFDPGPLMQVDSALSGVEAKLGLVGGKGDAIAALGKIVGTAMIPLLIYARVLLTVDMAMNKLRETAIGATAAVVDMGRAVAGLVSSLGLNGADAVKGLATGLAEGKIDLTKVATDLALAIPNAVEAKLQIESPSKVMRQLGEHTAEGYALGVSGGPTATFEPVISVGAPELGRGGGVNIGGGVSVSVSVHNTTATSPEEIGDVVTDKVRTQVLQLFAEMAEA